MSNAQAWLIGGKFDDVRANLSRTPPRIVVAGVPYERIDDPDTGEYLGAYAHINERFGK